MLLAFVPVRLRDRLAPPWHRWCSGISKKQIYIARTNLALCFPQRANERDAILMTSIGLFFHNNFS